MNYQIEVTDTFGGEANYSWVRRYTMPAPKTESTRAIVRDAKRVAGWQGPTTTTDDGLTITVRPRGECVVMFISQNWSEA